MKEILTLIRRKSKQKVGAGQFEDSQAGCGPSEGLPPACKGVVKSVLNRSSSGETYISVARLHAEYWDRASGEMIEVNGRSLADAGDAGDTLVTPTEGDGTLMLSS